MPSLEQRSTAQLARLHCPYCNGSGAIRVRDHWNRPHWHQCAMCSGKGYIVAEQQRPEPEAA